MDELRKILIILSHWEILRGFVFFSQLWEETRKGKSEFPCPYQAAFSAPYTHTQNLSLFLPSTWKPSLRKLCVVRLGNVPFYLILNASSKQMVLRDP